MQFTLKEKKILRLASLGGMLEFYDFIIYGVFSIYFAHQFFPSENSFIVILESYVIFALGYIVRPLGGIIFSHIGDEYGRKKVLVITMILMGIASLGIGLLPTYSQAGLFATVSLLVLRLIQGLAVGGELPSTFVYISETLPQKRGVAFSIVMTAINGGLLLGIFINYALTHLLTDHQLAQFGWRLPFIFGGLICIISYRVRKALEETEDFIKIKNKMTFPFVHLLRNNTRQLLAGIAIVAGMSSLVVLALVFMPTYLRLLNIDNNKISYFMVTIMIFNTIIISASGRIIQFLNPFTFLKYTLLLCFISVPFAYLCFWYHAMLIGLLFLGFTQGCIAAVTPYILTCLFESSIRLTGVASCYNIGFTLFGGLAPLIVTHIIHRGFDVYLTPVAYLLFALSISSLGLMYVTRHKYYVDVPIMA